jgi:hypothetical protein
MVFNITIVFADLQHIKKNYIKNKTQSLYCVLGLKNGFIIAWVDGISLQVQWKPLNVITVNVIRFHRSHLLNIIRDHCKSNRLLLSFSSCYQF